jgi:hypothetical protein
VAGGGGDEFEGFSLSRQGNPVNFNDSTS